MDETLPGLYLGIVTDNVDPSGLMRVRVKIPSVLGEEFDLWALPCLPPGILSVPDIDDEVWIAFEAGDRDRPIWVGIYPSITREDSS
jgi:hypothetical protein